MDAMAHQIVGDPRLREPVTTQLLNETTTVAEVKTRPDTHDTHKSMDQPLMSFLESASEISDEKRGPRRSSQIAEDKRDYTSLFTSITP